MEEEEPLGGPADMRPFERIVGTPGKEEVLDPRKFPSSTVAAVGIR